MTDEGGGGDGARSGITLRWNKFGGDARGGSGSASAPYDVTPLRGSP